MHLSSASVDLTGDIVAAGGLTYPADPSGFFVPVEHESLRLSRLQPGLRISGCTAARHPSGFLETAPAGAVLAVPAPLALIVQHALRFGTKAPMEAALAHQDGWLFSAAPGDERREQPLSDWRLRLEDRGGEVHVRICAALAGSQLESWRKASGNFWPGGPGSRVDARFVVDPATRIACFGSYIEGAPNRECDGAPATPPDFSPSSFGLGQAPVGMAGAFGVSEGRWIDVGFFSGRWPSVAITEHNRVRRLASGFLTSGQYVWPRLWIEGLDVERVIESLGAGPSVFHEANGLRALLSEGGPEGWSRRAPLDSLELKLGPGGLIMTATLGAPESRFGRRVLLPWELLILRYPVLADRRDSAIGVTGPGVTGTVTWDSH